MLNMKRSAIILIGLIFVITGCDIQLEPRPFSTLTIAPPLNPYQSITETPPPPTSTVPLSTAEPLIPTPTPFIHVVREGETLYGIAIKYNISLDRLVSINPGLDTRALVVGSEVIIPLPEEEYNPPTPTPYPLIQDPPVCYSTTDGGMWCYAQVENNQSFPLENISLALNIYNSEQELVSSQIAFPPLNFLFPGQSIPVGAFIPDTQANQNQVNSTLLSAYPSDQKEPYVLISDYALEYSQENTVAQIRGIFEILEGDQGGDQVWIVGIGYSGGKPAAVRKWVSTKGLKQGKSYPFDFLLYSLGPRIDRVQLYSELH